MQWIRDGIPIQLKFLSERNFKKIGRTSIVKQKEVEWTTQQIADYVEQGVLIQLDQRPEVVSPMHTVPKGDLFRLIIDMRGVNEQVYNKKFKMETVRRILPFLQKGMWATKLDLHQGYMHTTILPEDQELLGIEWQGKYYKFTTLPFGLNISPRIFTKIVHAMVKKWREQG